MYRETFLQIQLRPLQHLIRKNCFSTEQNHPEYSILLKGQSGRQIAYLIFENFRVTGAMILTRIYADTYSLLVFEMMIFRNSIQSGTEFCCRGTKIPLDDILEGLYKLRIRESEKLKTVLELYDLEIHQKKLGPDYHRLKAVVKRSIEQEIRIKIFRISNGNFEKNAVVKNQGTKQRVQRILGRALCERKQLQFPPQYK